MSTSRDLAAKLSPRCSLHNKVLRVTVPVNNSPPFWFSNSHGSYNNPSPTISLLPVPRLYQLWCQRVNNSLISPFAAPLVHHVTQFQNPGSVGQILSYSIQCPAAGASVLVVKNRSDSLCEKPLARTLDSNFTVPPAPVKQSDDFKPTVPVKCLVEGWKIYPLNYRTVCRHTNTCVCVCLFVWERVCVPLGKHTRWYAWPRLN